MPGGCRLDRLRRSGGARRRIPRDAEQEDEREAEDEGRRPCRADAEACYCYDSAGAGERPVQAAFVFPGLQARGYQHGRAQHDGGARAQHPRRGRWGSAVMGVVDQADHRGPIAATAAVSGRWPSIHCTLGQVVGGLRDQHDHGQVIEELERADHALTRLLAMRAGRLPQGTAQPSPELCAGRTQA